MSTGSTGVRLAGSEQEYIRLHAHNHSVTSLSKVMGRDYYTVKAWARGNDVTFGRGGRQSLRRFSGKSLKVDCTARIERMMALACRRAA